MITSPRPLLAPVVRGIAVCLTAALLGGVASFLTTRRSVRAASPGSVVPFSAVEVVSRFSPQGELVWQESTDYYRFSDGSLANRGTQVYPEKGRALLGGALDLQLNRDLTLEPITKSVITMKRTKEQQLSFLAGLWEENCPDADDDVVASEPGGTILGCPTTHVTVRFGEHWREERWMVPRLRCFSVRKIDSIGSGSRNETEVTSLVEGEPPRSLLSAPGDYLERTPAEAEKAFALARGGAELFGARYLARLTKEYAVGR
jgi:hypothetical protein